MEHAKYNGSSDQASNNGSNSNEQLHEVTAVEDTPFHIVKMDEKYFLALGKYRLTQLFDKFEDVETEVVNSSWELLFRVISVVVTESIIQERMMMKPQDPNQIDIFKTNIQEGQSHE